MSICPSLTGRFLSHTNLISKDDVSNTHRGTGQPWAAGRGCPEGWVLGAEEVAGSRGEEAESSGRAAG